MKVKKHQAVLMLIMSFFFIVFTGYPAAAQWSITTVDSTGIVGRDTSLALDGSGNPRISYYRLDTGDVKYAWCDTGCDLSGNWNAIPVGSIGKEGADTSLALDGSGNPRISYHDDGDTSLQYTWCDVDCATTGNWNTIPVDSTGDVGLYTSLALNASGNPRVSYYKSDTDDLKYAWCDTGCDDPGNWNNITVADTGTV